VIWDCPLGFMIPSAEDCILNTVSFGRRCCRRWLQFLRERSRFVEECFCFYIGFGFADLIKLLSVVEEACTGYAC